MAASPSEIVEIVEQTVWRPAPAEVAEPPWIGHVRLSPDGERLAFVQVTEDGAGIFVEERDGQVAQLASCDDELLPEDLLWSPGGDRIAYRLAEDDSQRCKSVVGWLSSTPPPAGEPVPVTSELERIMATAFHWRPDGEAVALFSGESHTIAFFDVAPSEPGAAGVSLIGRARDSDEPRFPARIAIARDGARIALVVRDTFDECLSVWVYEAQEDGGYQRSHLTEVPGTLAYVCPFWSAKGVSLGLLISHLERQRSGIVMFLGGKKGQRGITLYESDLCDPPQPPAYGPAGKSIAFFQTVQDPDDPKHLPARLVLLGCHDHAITPLCEPGEISGAPRFTGSRTLVIDGEDQATVLKLSAKC